MAGKSLNKVTIIGNLGRDPELRFTQGGRAVVNFTVATSETFQGKDGTPQEKTEWHKCVAWGKLAEIINQYLSKGKKVYLEGKLQTRDWEDKEGKKRYMTEIVINEMIMLDSKGGGASSGKSDETPPDGPEPVNDAPEDDIPF